MHCPFCGHDGPPVLEKRVSTNGWIVFAVLLVVCLPLCWIPLVMDNFKEVVPKCASCFSRLS
jgi:lipopolysaccharide-induced tumor necrosis factor-alpha factor